MTIQISINDGRCTSTSIYRNVIRNKSLAEFRESFYANREWARWGIMCQLKGKEEILLAQF